MGLNFRPFGNAPIEFQSRTQAFRFIEFTQRCKQMALRAIELHGPIEGYVRSVKLYEADIELARDFLRRH